MILSNIAENAHNTIKLTQKKCSFCPWQLLPCYPNSPSWLLWLQVLPLRGYQERLAAYNRIGHHDNICGVLDVVIGQDNVYIFLPGHHGDMHAYVRSRKRLDEEEAQLLFAQMLNAVTHCHQHGVVLRDLKLRRFVFTDRYRWVSNTGTDTTTNTTDTVHCQTDAVQMTLLKLKYYYWYCEALQVSLQLM